MSSFLPVTHLTASDVMLYIYNQQNNSLKEDHTMVATQILAKVEQGRWQKAVEAWASGAYRITVTRQSEQEVRGFVANGDGKEYGVTLAEGRSFCGCK